eukprot:scaffold30149_cov18-Tisochrysis_lutea.AAC.1
MLQLLCTQPESAVSISTNAKISVALMKRTDSVCDEAGSSSQGNIPVVALTPRPRSAGTDGFFYAEIQDLSASSCFVHAQSRSDSGARWQPVPEIEVLVQVLLLSLLITGLSLPRATTKFYYVREGTGHGHWLLICCASEAHALESEPHAEVVAAAPWCYQRYSPCRWCIHGTRFYK